MSKYIAATTILLMMLVSACSTTSKNLGEGFDAGTDSGSGGIATGGTNTDAGAAGSTTGGTGGTGAAGGSGGIATGGTAGNTGGTQAGGSAGSVACQNGLLPEAVQADLGVTNCEDLFGTGPCGSNSGLSRGELAFGIANYLESSNYLGGYTAPDPAIYPDDADLTPGGQIYDAVAKATWAKVIPDQGLTYDPNSSAECTWWEDELLPVLQNLPEFYTLVRYFGDDSLPASWTGSRSMTYTVYRSSPGKHFIKTLRVANNLAGDFTSPTQEDAISAVYFDCEDVEGQGVTQSPSLPLANGAIDIDCYDQSEEDGFTITLRVNFASEAQGANAGDQVRVGIHPDDLEIWGVTGSNTEVPIFTIQ